MVRLRHEHVLLGDVGFLNPLLERVGPVQHHIPGQGRAGRDTAGPRE